ncbi:MAG: hypothetical protein ABJK28_03300 [Algibacter sp.]
MKTSHLYILIIACTLSMVSCSGEDIFSTATTIKVVNLIKGEDDIIIKIGDTPINYTTTEAKVAFEGYRNVSILEGVNKKIKIVKKSDTISPIYSEILNLKDIHSLYVFGNKNESDAFLIEDQLKQYTDSIVGVRFINVSKLAGPIAVNIVGGSTVITGLDQESATDFIEFPATAADGSYTFEFKDTSGNLLNTVTLDPLENRNIAAKKNLTFAIYDFQINDFVTFQRIFRVNSY